MKKFNIPVTWEVWDVVEVEAETLEEAIKYVKENIDTIPLGKNTEYLDGTYKIYDGEDGGLFGSLCGDFQSCHPGFSAQNPLL